MTRASFDEMCDARTQVRPHYQAYQRWLGRQADRAMQARREEAEMIFRRVASPLPCTAPRTRTAPAPSG